jgi:hypothetical protein
MASTYEPIATTTLGSAASEIIFDNIPQTYTDLVVIVNARRTDAATDGSLFLIPWNSSLPASPQSLTTLVGNGSSAASGRSSNQDGLLMGLVPAGNAASGTFGIAEVHLMNYSNTTTFKTLLCRSNNAGTDVRAEVGLTRTTAAITRLYILTFSAVTMLAGSSASLYGIKAA